MVNTNSGEVHKLQVHSKMALVDTAFQSPFVRSFLAGSFSGTCSAILFQPLELVKTRLQTAPVAGIEAGGMVAIVGRVVKADHILGLWRGMTPSIVRCVPGVGIYFSSLQWLTQTVSPEGSPSMMQAVFLGAMARTLTVTITIPATVVKTRYESEIYAYRNWWEALSTIYKKEGPRGLRCGLLATLMRDAPFSGLYLMFYTQTKQIIPKEYLTGEYSAPIAQFGSGCLAGLLASFVTQPCDVIKTKMQLYPTKFDSVIEIIPFVYNKYGMQGFFKGLAPRLMRRTLNVAMVWTVYEQIMKKFGLK